MKRRVNLEKAIRVLREMEVLQSQGNSITEACRKLGIKDHTYYRWKKEYGGLDIDQARRLKILESENVRLKKSAKSCTFQNAGHAECWGRLEVLNAVGRSYEMTMMR